MPGDVFRHMSGPRSWLVSLLLGLAGAAVGRLLFTALLGIGDADVFDFGGIVSAVIGVLIVLPIAGLVLRRTGLSPQRPRGARSTGGRRRVAERQESAITATPATTTAAPAARARVTGSRSTR
jgi:uncharacterized membrane protein YeaQ/YmgE (transglycosylase-associated protein family)